MNTFANRSLPVQLSLAKLFTFRWQFTVISAICGIIGIIKPSIFLSKKKEYKYPRLSVFGCAVGAIILFAIIGTATAPKEMLESDTPSAKQIEETAPELIQLSDEQLTKILKHEFDSLYNRLVNIDTIDPLSRDRKGMHKEIQSFLYDGWWNLMESADSSRTKLPLCRKEYANACKKYDKEYAKFLIYGNEDEFEVKEWAKYEAERVLRQVLKDPKSLEIIEVSSCTKVAKGYRCIVKYRAKNGFGGYNVDNLDMVLAWKDEEGLYRCIDAK